MRRPLSEFTTYGDNIFRKTHGDQRILLTSVALDQDVGNSLAGSDRSDRDAVTTRAVVVEEFKVVTSVNSKAVILVYGKIRERKG
jgi:hypothetical protein